MKPRTFHFLVLFLLAGLLVRPAAAADEPNHQASPEKPAAPKHVRNVGVDEFDKLRADKSNTVLDVRTKEEFEKGHIPGAVNLDVHSPDFAKKVGELDKNKTYLVHCAAGVRSARACTIMDQLEFKNLVNLEPGFRAWEKAGKPVEK